MDSFNGRPAQGRDLDGLLREMVALGASDMHLKAAVPPIVRVHGVLKPLGDKPMSLPECENIIFSSMTHAQQQEFMETKELDFAYGLHGHGRFRVNAFFQRGTVSAAFRTVRLDIPSMEELRVPSVLKDLCELQDGIVLLTGATGTGKSTTLAAMIDHINTTQRRHIVTIEDPIEYIHVDKQSIISQREVGIDTGSFTIALKQSLRQDPDVILIGEMRDPETIITALTAAETGHLVLSTLHTQNTIQALERIMDALPEGDRSAHRDADHPQPNPRRQVRRHVSVHVRRQVRRHADVHAVAARLVPERPGHGKRSVLKGRQADRIPPRHRGPRHEWRGYAGDRRLVERPATS